MRFLRTVHTTIMKNRVHSFDGVLLLHHNKTQININGNESYHNNEESHVP